MLRSSSKPKGVHWGGAAHEGYFFTTSKDSNNSFRFAMVTDLDQLSRVTSSTKPLFRSELLPGTLTFDSYQNQYTVEFAPESRTLQSSHNEAGRGMELSELTLYNGRLLAFDDRTGSVFEILSQDKGDKNFVVPRFVITEGEGDTDKGMKWEWATVKDNNLYIGSMGKEYTNPDGTVANSNNLWISIISPKGEITRVDWTSHYDVVRKALHAESPGYVIHEAVLWSEHLKKWMFLPRRVSSETYDEVKDEKMGSNKVVLVDDAFNNAEVVDIKMAHIDKLHGFSSVAFIPGTKDLHALALRSVEEDCVGGEEDVCKQRTYAIVFNVLTGEVLMEEVLISELKFEGVEFVDVTAWV